MATPLVTRETVAMETPALWATAEIEAVGLALGSASDVAEAGLLRAVLVMTQASIVGSPDCGDGSEQV